MRVLHNIFIVLLQLNLNVSLHGVGRDDYTKNDPPFQDEVHLHTASQSNILAYNHTNKEHVTKFPPSIKTIYSKKQQNNENITY